MEQLFDSLSFECSKRVTNKYSTSFSMATNLLEPEIKKHIHSVYGFVRIADEIVDTFHDWDKELLLQEFEDDFLKAYKSGISLNPVLNSFQLTVKKYNIPFELIDAFLGSMRMDLHKMNYETQDEYKKYIYGSADVVGLMCLKIFVNGDDEKYEELKESAMRLGSAFQKVNFLRDLKNDVEDLNRSYFPNVDFSNLDQHSKQAIVDEIEDDFRAAYKGIVNLPAGAKFGVYTAYVYYKQLLEKLKNTPPLKIMNARIRIADHTKMSLLLKSFVNVKLNLV